MMADDDYVIEWGDGPIPTNTVVVDYTCQVCLREFGLPVVGTAVAQIGTGIVFDVGNQRMPLMTTTQVNAVGCSAGLRCTMSNKEGSDTK